MSEQETEALRREIERTRAELGATVEALSNKADVKTQAREKVEHAKQNVQEQARERPVVPVAAGIAAALVVLLIIRRKRS
jgi:type VI protein secretion system component VasF